MIPDFKSLEELHLHTMRRRAILRRQRIISSVVLAVTLMFIAAISSGFLYYGTQP